MKFKFSGLNIAYSLIFLILLFSTYLYKRNAFNNLTNAYFGKFLEKFEIYNDITLSSKTITDQNWNIFIIDLCCDFPEKFEIEKVIRLDLTYFKENSQKHEFDVWDPFVLDKKTMVHLHCFMKLHSLLKIKNIT